MTEAAVEAFHAALRDDDAEQLYDRAPCGYLSTAPDGMIVKVNQTFLTWTGYERGELVGHRTFAQLLAPGGRIYHETHYAPLLRMQGSVREIALDIVTASGERLPVLVNSVLEVDDAGVPRVVRTAVFDATSRREYERELLRAKDAAEESELRARRLAQTLQETLIPPAPPVIPGLDVGAVYRPAGDGEEVGGDFYDVFQVSHGDWVAVIGDVCGKGVDAAVVTALVRYTVRAFAVQEPRPSAVLRSLNDVLLTHDTDRFCTVGLVRLREQDGTWTAVVSTGGHPLALRLSRDAPPTTFGRPGALLGALPDPELYDDEITLCGGDGLLLYTDGVTEGRRGDAFFEESGLYATLSRCPTSPASGLAQCVVDDVVSFQHDRPRDDIAVVVILVPDDDAPRVTRLE